jgi:predicted DNA-binding transcriptional regulator AlpA
MDAIGLKKTKIYKMIAEGSFPKPIKISKVSLWDERAINEWIANAISNDFGKA